MRLALALVLLAAGGGTARARAPATSLPLCWAPEKGAMGAWTSYSISFGRPGGDTPAMQMEERVALVGRAPGQRLLESQSRMASVTGAPWLVMQAVLGARDTSGTARSLIVQVEDGQPLDTGAQRPQPDMAPPDFVRASAGRGQAARLPFRGKVIATRVLEARGPDGLRWRVWCSDQVQPLGVVRLEVRGERNGQPMVYDMTARATGRGARARVVGKPQPYSDAAMMREMNRAMLQKLQAGQTATAPPGGR